MVPDEAASDSAPPVHALDGSGAREAVPIERCYDQPSDKMSVCSFSS